MVKDGEMSDRTPLLDSSGERRTDPVLIDHQSGVVTITMNMPERKNSLSAELINGVCDAIDATNADPSSRVIVLTNTGNTFCAGADLKASKPGIAPGAHGAKNRTFVDLLTTIQQSPIPVVGRINGHATGGGVGLTAVCDISVMRNDAKIGFTEVRLGVAPAVISVVCLPKMRQADASELFLSGERFTPGRAQAVGLINRAVEPDEIDKVIEEFVDKIVRGAPLALAASKELIATVPDMELADAFAWTAERSQALFESDDAKAGIAAFRDRQPAPWVPEDRR